MVYGGTSGRAAHLFVGMFHGATGMVLDMGVVEGATECVAVCCGQQKVAGFVNGPAGGRAVTRPLQGLPFDLLQEWGFSRLPYGDIGEIVPGERVVHFTAMLDEGAVEVLAEVEGKGRVVCDSEGAALGADADRTLWRLAPGSATLERRAITLPSSFTGDAPAAWARCPTSDCLFVADGEGRLFALDGRGEFGDVLGQVRHAPVRAMAVTADGRLFGWCGEGIARMFRYDPWADELRDVGCAVSVLERRRYGYQFAAAAVGRDGQVYFGEDDDLGHLWIYFPRVLPPR